MKGVTFMGGDMERKRVLIDGNVLHQKAKSLHENVSKRPPETSDHIHINF